MLPLLFVRPRLRILTLLFYDAVMFMPGFTDEALLAAYSHLLDNKAHGSAFVKMNDSHRVLWLRSYLAKHYYM